MVPVPTLAVSCRGEWHPRLPHPKAVVSQLPAQFPEPKFSSPQEHIGLVSSPVLSGHILRTSIESEMTQSVVAAELCVCVCVHTRTYKRVHTQRVLGQL